MTLNALFDEAADRLASDIHLATGEPPRVRLSGALHKLDVPALDRASLSALLEPVLPGDWRVRLDAGTAFEKTIVRGDLAFAGIVFRTGDDELAATFRVIKKGIPTLDEIGFSALPTLRRIAEAPRGLVFIVGPVGSGKWTTACSLVDDINGSKPARIFVVEAHPNYRFDSKQGMVTQLHVGQDCDSYNRALEIAHQADLDVVQVDDIPSDEVLRQLLVLSETGHLVIANLHADDIYDAVQRLFATAGSNTEALGRALARNLVAIIGQRLLPRRSGGRVPAYEWLWVTAAMQEALALADLAAIQQVQSTDSECRNGQVALDELAGSGEITPEIAAANRTVARSR
jgi:Tfp pilus assembly pilus retraction ATPase PilT